MIKDQWVIVSSEGRVIEKGMCSGPIPRSTFHYTRKSALEDLKLLREAYSDKNLIPQRAGEFKRWGFKIMKLELRDE